MDAMISLLVFVLVFGLVAYLIFWAMGYLGAPEPIRKVVTVVVVIIGLLVLIGYLPGLGSHGFHWPYR